MSEINSPIGKRTFTSKPMKQFEVPDFESGQGSEKEFINKEYSEKNHFSDNISNNELNELEEKRKLRELQLNKASERLSPGALERMNILLGLTKTTKVVDLGNNVTFTLQSLKNKETREVLIAVSKFGGFESSFEMRRQYLARSIVKVTDYDLETFISSNLLEDKLLFVDELDDGVANKLYDEFTLLNNEVKERYSVNTVDDAKEVADHLKK